MRRGNEGRSYLLIATAAAADTFPYKTTLICGHLLYDSVLFIPLLAGGRGGGSGEGGRQQTNSPSPLPAEMQSTLHLLNQHMAPLI